MQRLLGVISVHCMAHRLNLINGDGLECLPIVVSLNVLCKVVNTEIFRLSMLAAQAEHHPNTPILKLRFVSFQCFVIKHAFCDIILQATASRWSSFVEQWQGLERMWPIIEAAWMATKRDMTQLPQLDDLKALKYIFLPVEKCLKAVCCD